MIFFFVKILYKFFLPPLNKFFGSILDNMYKFYLPTYIYLQLYLFVIIDNTYSLFYM